MSEQLDEWIAAWLRGDISAADREKLEQRLAQDPDLREELDELKQLDEFEQYASGQLPESEAAAFAERLAGDEALRREYADYQATRRVLEIDRIGNEQDAVRAEIERQRTQKKNEPPTRKPWRKRLPLLVLGLLLLVTLSIPFWPEPMENPTFPIDTFPVPVPPPVPPGDTTPIEKEEPSAPPSLRDPVFASLVDAALRTPYPAAGDVSLGSDRGVTDIQQAYLREEYDSLHINTPSNRLDSLIAAGDRTRDVVLLASARLLSDPPQCQSAYDLLTRLEASRARQLGRFMQAADWYRALSLLCRDQRTAAVPILRDIAGASGGHEFKRAAQELLAALPE